MPIIGRLGDRERAHAFALIMQEARGKDFNDAAMDLLVGEIRQRFAGKPH
jgi:hypothetical protein